MFNFSVSCSPECPLPLPYLLGPRRRLFAPVQDLHPPYGVGLRTTCILCTIYPLLSNPRLTVYIQSHAEGSAELKQTGSELGGAIITHIVIFVLLA
jgi:hypothetical protein